MSSRVEQKRAEQLGSSNKSRSFREGHRQARLSCLLGSSWRLSTDGIGSVYVVVPSRSPFTRHTPPHRRGWRPIFLSALPITWLILLIYLKHPNTTASNTSQGSTHTRTRPHSSSPGTEATTCKHRGREGQIGKEYRRRVIVSRKDPAQPQKVKPKKPLRAAHGRGVGC